MKLFTAYKKFKVRLAFHRPKFIRLFKKFSFIVFKGVLIYPFCMLAEYNDWIPFKATLAYHFPFDFVSGLINGDLNPYISIVYQKYQHAEYLAYDMRQSMGPRPRPEISFFWGFFLAPIFLFALAFGLFLVSLTPFLWGILYQLFLKLFHGRHLFAVLSLTLIISGLTLFASQLRQDAIITLVEQKKIVYPYPNPPMFFPSYY